MKKTILLALILLSSKSFSLDFQADAWKGNSDTNYTGRAGFSTEMFSTIFGGGTTSIGVKPHLEFTNIELGAILNINNGPNTDGFTLIKKEENSFTVSPYMKSGDDIFIMFLIRDENSYLIRVGFNFF